MTSVLIPPVLNGAGDVNATATVAVRLVLASGLPAIGLTADGLLSEYDDLAIGDGLELSLTPQADIVLPDGAATYYQITITAGRGLTTVYLVQVPDSVSPVPLSTLVGADAITPGDAAAQAISTAVDAGIAAFAAAPVFNPPDTATPAVNGAVTMALTDDHTLTLSARGADGVVRQITLTLIEP